MLTAALLIAAHRTPTATLAEPEISLVRLAQKSLDATGEPVTLDPDVRPRAVAIFVRDAPWPEVWRLVGEATGAECRDGRLVATRDLSEKALTASTLAAARAALARPERKDSLPSRLVAERLKRLALPLGTTVLFDGRALLNEDEILRLSELNLQKPLKRVRAAARLLLVNLEVGVELLDAKNRREVLTESLPLGKPPIRSWELLKGLAWTDADLPPRHLRYNWSIGDYAALLHAKTGLPVAAPALRVGMDPPGVAHEPGDVTQKGWPGAVLRRKGEIVLTSPLGGGFWPADFSPVEMVPNPGLAEYADLATRHTPAQRAWTAWVWGDAGLGEGSLVHRQGPTAFDGRSAALRLIGAVGPERIAALSERRRWRRSALPSEVGEAIRRYAVEESSPNEALAFGDAFDLAVSFHASVEPTTLLLTRRTTAYGGWAPGEKTPDTLFGSKILANEPARSESVILEWGDAPDLNSPYDLGFMRRVEAMRVLPQK